MGNYHMAVEGDIDLAIAPRLEKDLLHAIRVGTGDVVIDFTDVTFLDSSGVHVLINAAAALVDQGRELRLHGLRSTVRLAIDVLGLADTFNCPA
jgi:anti-sigma B factor antagonist